jgi:hypothetical protein
MRITAGMLICTGDGFWHERGFAYVIESWLALDMLHVSYAMRLPQG